MRIHAVNFGDAANNKRRPSFILQGCPDVDQDGHFDPDKVLRRIKELETIAHKVSIKTATALVQTMPDIQRQNLNAYIANGARVRFASRNAMLPSLVRSLARKP